LGIGGESWSAKNRGRNGWGGLLCYSWGSNHSGPPDSARSEGAMRRYPDGGWDGSLNFL
jgi:hypothetical protein